MHANVPLLFDRDQIGFISNACTIHNLCICMCYVLLMFFNACGYPVLPKSHVLWSTRVLWKQIATTMGSLFHFVAPMSSFLLKLYLPIFIYPCYLCQHTLILHTCPILLKVQVVHFQLPPRHLSFITHCKLIPILCNHH